MKLLFRKNEERELANYQLSIINFANNFQLSKRVVASLFENLRIDNYLKIGNWKLIISDPQKTMLGFSVNLIQLFN